MHKAPSLKPNEVQGPHPMPFFAIDYGNAVTVSLSTTTAASSALSAGAYMLVSDAAVHLNEGAATPTAATSDGLLPANQMMPHFIDTDNNMIAGILASGTGTLYIIPVRAA